ncbi:MAG: FadR family transcriptional regulator [Deltaproteobacteria bacterium]|nr:FadR family transcriptional regulator [Deltaproteobacteria bacterium]
MAQFEPIRVKKLAEEVGQRIKRSIFDGTFISGEKLPSEHDMAVQFGVSQITVRQAVRVLESAGIVYTKQGVEGGIFVAKADPTTVSSYLSDMLRLKKVTQSDLFMSRFVFEPDIAATVTENWEKGDLKELEENIKLARRTLSRGDGIGARVCNLTFHRILCSITKNPVIIFALNAVFDVLEENAFKLKLTDHMIHDEIEEHSVLMKIISARDTNRVRVEMQKHIQKVHDELRRQDG